jgi:hypothetical protein
MRVPAARHERAASALPFMEAKVALEYFTDYEKKLKDRYPERWNEVVSALNRLRELIAESWKPNGYENPMEWHQALIDQIWARLLKSNLVREIHMEEDSSYYPGPDEMQEVLRDGYMWYELQKSGYRASPNVQTEFEEFMERVPERFGEWFAEQSRKGIQ